MNLPNVLRFPVLIGQNVEELLTQKETHEVCFFQRKQLSGGPYPADGSGGNTRGSR